MTRRPPERARALLGDQWRQGRGVTAKRCVWENVCPENEGPYTTTPASKMTC
jgi:hypothetical protein